MGRIPDTTKEQIRTAASGQWPDILARIAGIPADVLDGKHHPCPKCGGDDRFRLIDEKTGAILCNQCFSKKNGDGFAAISWSLGCKFNEALEKVAAHLGIKIKTKARGNVDPEKDLDFRPWSSNLVRMFLAKKPGVTEESLLAAGAKMAMYKRNYSVICLPIIGQSLDTTKPVGWVMMGATGGTLPTYDQEGKITGHKKVKITYGSGPGLIGVAAIERLKLEGAIDRVWKCEGISDSLAVAALIPADARVVALSNANGAEEKPRWMASILASYETIIIHDADEAGEVGAKTWSHDIAVQGGKVAIARLPYEIAKDQGKDVRDWIGEGHGWESLQKLAEDAERIEAKRDEKGEIVADEDADTHFERKICRDLQIEVLGETDDGHIKLFSLFHRKAVTITDIGRLSYDRLTQIVGPLAKAKIHKGIEQLENVYRFSDVREAIALIAGYRRTADHNEVGLGIWRGRQLSGDETESIVLVNGSDASRWNGDKVLRKVIAPRVDGLLLDLGGGGDWFDHDRLASHLTAVGEGPQFAESAIEETEELFREWRWRNQQTDPMLITGLIMASWVQTVWRWRPGVAVTGESNSGKSYLFQTLAGEESLGPGIFGSLAFKQAKSTEAGLRQGIGRTAMVILCDEFEQSRERGKVLELIRTAGRGEKIMRGTSGQRALRFGLQHIVWVAAIETGLTKQADRNRYICFDLLRADAMKKGKLKLKPSKYLVGLGEKLLAVALRNALAAVELAVELKGTQVDGIDPRQIESYAVPAAMLATACHYDRDQAEQLLRGFLATVEKDEQGHSDHADLLDDILASQVNTGPRHGVLSVGQILESHGLWMDYSPLLEAKGVKLAEGDCLFVATDMVRNHLLRGTSWDGQRIDQILRRVEGAVPVRTRLAGSARRGFKIPIQLAQDTQREIFD